MLLRISLTVIILTLFYNLYKMHKELEELEQIKQEFIESKKELTEVKSNEYE